MRAKIRAGIQRAIGRDQFPAHFRGRHSACNLTTDSVNEPCASEAEWRWGKLQKGKLIWQLNPWNGVLCSLIRLIELGFLNFKSTERWKLDATLSMQQSKYLRRRSAPRGWPFPWRVSTCSRRPNASHRLTDILNELVLRRHNKTNGRLLLVQYVNRSFI